jgi:hypothetical protein
VVISPERRSVVPVDPPGTGGDDLESLVAMLCRIPDSVRQFTRDSDWAWRQLRIRPAFLETLGELGLPRRYDSSGHRYDQYDLLNCSLELGQGVHARSVRRFWPQALRRAAEGTLARYELRFQVRCPEPGHGGPCDYVVALPGGGVFQQTVEPGGRPPGPTVEVSPAIDWPEVPAQARPAIDDVRHLDFVILNEQIRWDLEFSRVTGLADCAGCARLLVEAALRRGLQARTGFGYLVAPPFALEHFWTELRVGDTWVPIDPMLIRRLVRWGALDEATWPVHRSIGPLIVRVSQDAIATAQHNGERIPVTMPVRLLSGPE